MFFWPLYRAKLRTPALKTAAKKTLVGAVSGMFTLTTNMLVFVIEGRRELAGVYIIVSVLQVTIDALILYWVSSGAPSDSVYHFALPAMPLPRSSQSMTSANFERSVKHAATANETTLASTTIQTLHNQDHFNDPERQVITQDAARCSVLPVTWKDV
ncbi:hypothetical protein V5O48_008809 [Marasmius crinis-equi]|uniref:Uncharacterized protein n=1 Tax=Marasmius crinis-equi TaxID=585013 RepID=A0ABR3FDE1_9AGAR